MRLFYVDEIGYEIGEVLAERMLSSGALVFDEGGNLTLCPSHLFTRDEVAALLSAYDGG